MKFSKEIYIATEKITIYAPPKEGLDYSKWVEFVENQDEFIWRENTSSGKITLASIDKVPESFKEKALASLNKIICHYDYDEKKGYYNINASFQKNLNRIHISFERKPKIEEIIILKEMAEHLEALLLNDGTKIIDQQFIDSL